MLHLFPLLAQIEAEATLQEKSFLSLVLDADPIVKFTLLVLMFFSIVSWAIIFYKYRQVKQAQGDSQSFWNAFSQSKSLQDVVNQKGVRSGPLYEIYQVAMQVAPLLKKRGKTGQLERDSIVQRLAQTREEEIYKLEQYTPFLATTASAAPFIGLFGTVWGILTAFWAIGKAGSSSLATVGPYISEALIATAIGLAAAIPAVIAYNHFVHRIKIVIKMMDLFSDDLVSKIEEEIAS
ncbi:MAG: MotA/TolQ/ExbB proton channel family protein [Deltaproteobacteria bacterium]|nr:MotA/TolQ/ExbB proton channel family protein [Deltaproteobacteria bacterium]